MDWVIRLLSLVGGMGMLAGAFTLGTCCVLQKWSVVIVSSNQWGFVCTCACVILWMALTHSANACITLSACVMDGLVMRLC
jgi:hypothetical protein